MGSFNATCIVSNLPIECGTPVRFLTLTHSTYNKGNEHVCYVGGRWQLRGAPIKSEYNDYGTIEDWDDSLTSKVFFKSFDTDAVEKGVGDNSCHDVHVRHGMSDKEWIDALWESRVEVTDHQSSYPADKPYVTKDEYIDKGIPTLYRIEKVLSDAGFKSVTAWGAEGYLVSDVTHGFIRIRLSGHSEDFDDFSKLEALLPIIKDAGYAAMITAGSGSYSNNAEILVTLRPTKHERGYYMSTPGLAPEPNSTIKPRPVSLAMIREDVWQILLSTPLQTWTGSKQYTFEKMKGDALKHLDETLAREAEIEKLKKEKPGDDRLFSLMMRVHDLDFTDRDNLFSSFLYPREGESGFTLKKAFRFGLEQGASKEELVQYVTDLAETAYIQAVYSMLHGQWHPTTNSGQDGNWEEHRTFLQKLLEIKGRWEEEEEYDDEEGEEVFNDKDEDEDDDG